MNKDKELSSKELKKLVQHLKSTGSLPNDTPIAHQMQVLKELPIKDFKNLARAITNRFDEQAFTALFSPEHREKLEFIIKNEELKIPFALSLAEDAPHDLIRRHFMRIRFPSKDDVDFFIKHADDIFLECITNRRIDDKFIEALIKNNRLDLVELQLKASGIQSINSFLTTDLARRDDFCKIAKTFFSTQYYKDDAFFECVRRKDITSILIALDYLYSINCTLVTIELFELNNAEVINKWVDKICTNRSHCLCHDRRDALLMRPIYKQAIKQYIEKFDLSKEAEIALIKLQDNELTLQYIDKVEDLDPVAEELLFSLYDSKVTSAYQMTSGLSLSREREMIVKNHFPTINAYISVNALYSQNEILLFKTCSEELCLKYIELHDPSDIADAYLMKYGRIKLVEARIKKCISTENPLYDSVEVIFFSKHNKELTLPYLKAIKPSSIDKVLPYLSEEHYDFLGKISNTGAHNFMANTNASCESILLFAKKQGLTSQCLEILIRKKRIDVLSKLFETMSLPTDVQKQMMHKEYLDIIAEYIKYHDLEPMVEATFVQIATKDILEFYLERYVISEGAEHTMIKLGLF